MAKHNIQKKKRLSTPVFVFDDYVDYLRAWYDYAKRYRLTQNTFIKLAGVGSQAYFSDILSKRKKLALKHVQGFIIALELSGDQAQYFSLLVQKEHATKGDMKVTILKKLAQYREKNLNKIVANNQAEYFSSWKYPLIREYIESRGYVGSVKEISRSFLHCSIPLAEIRRIVDKLIGWKLITQDTEHGGFRSANTPEVITYSSMPHAVVNDVKRFYIESSLHAMETLSMEDRHISMSIKGISREKYEQFCTKVDQLRKEFLECNEKGENCNIVYALNVQLFPVMKSTPDQSWTR